MCASSSSSTMPDIAKRLKKGKAHMGAAWLSPPTDPALQAGPSYYASANIIAQNENTLPVETPDDLDDKPVQVVAGSRQAMALQELRKAVPAYPDQRAQADQRTAAPRTDRRTVRGFGTRRPRGSRHRIELLPAAPVRALGRQRNANRLVISRQRRPGAAGPGKAFIESRRDDVRWHAWSTAILATWAPERGRQPAFRRAHTYHAAAVPDDVPGCPGQHRHRLATAGRPRHQGNRNGIRSPPVRPACAA